MVFHICLVNNFSHVIIGICMRYRNKYMCALEKWTKSPNLSVHISCSVSCVYLVYFGYYETDIAMTCGIFFSRKVNVHTFFVEIELSFDWFANDDEKDCVWYDLEVFTSNKYIDWFKCILFFFGCTPRIDVKKMVFAASRFLSKINQRLSFTVPKCAANK